MQDAVIEIILFDVADVIATSNPGIWDDSITVIWLSEQSATTFNSFYNVENASPSRNRVETKRSTIDPESEEILSTSWDFYAYSGSYKTLSSGTTMWNWSEGYNGESLPASKGTEYVVTNEAEAAEVLQWLGQHKH